MRVVFVNGTFDILHRGHIEMLNYAKSLGDKLVVAIDSDCRVKTLKGCSRPINKQDDRKFHLQNLKSVDVVEVFCHDIDLENLILKHKASIMVKGSDYKDKPVIGSSLLRIEYYDRTEHSTTKTIQSIIGGR
jgi:rfaE bifunctional protein nucleotidyltransferase chain/domain